jgi:hypothetical protein
MLVACAATLLGWYNDLEQDVGGSNAIVSKIRMAAQKWDIKDSTITATVGAPMWPLTLKSWSKMVKDDFEAKTPESVSSNATLAQQYWGINEQLSSVLSRQGKLESAIATMNQNAIANQTLIEAVQNLTNHVSELTSNLEQERRKSSKLQSRAADLMKVVSDFASGTPASVKGTATATIDVHAAAASIKQTLDADIDAEHCVDEDAPPAKQSKPNAFDAMDGVYSANLSTGDVNVKSELVRLHSTGVFQEKKKEEVVTKCALFDSDNRYFFGYNPQLLADRHGGKSHNTAAMTLVAISIDGAQFDELLDDAAVRAIAADVSKEVNEQIRVLFIRY